jgi:hypothetical protein
VATAQQSASLTVDWNPKTQAKHPVVKHSGASNAAKRHSVVEHLKFGEEKVKLGDKLTNSRITKCSSEYVSSLTHKSAASALLEKVQLDLHFCTWDFGKHRFLWQTNDQQQSDETTT